MRRRLTALISLVWAMSAVLLSWIALGAVQIGLGLAVQRFAGVRRIDADRCLLAFWIGYAVLVALLQLWHMAFPVTWHALAGACVLGAAALAWCARDLVRWLRPALDGNRTVILAIAVAGLWAANQAIGPGDAHDSGLYHYQVLRWINEHPIVTGLVNLGTAYAVNTSSLLHVAMVNTGPWSGRGEHVANGFLLWALFAQVIVALVRLHRGRGHLLSNVYGALLLVPAVMLLFSREITSPKTDLAGNILIFVIGWRLLVALEGRAKPSREGLYDVAALCALAALAPCLKLSVAFFAASAWAVAVVTWVLRHRRDPVPRDWGFIWAAAASVAFVGPWIARNVITSGYPFYPSSIVHVPVEWRLPRKTVELYEFHLRSQPQGRLALLMADRLQDSPLSWYGRLIDPPYDHWEEIQGSEWFVPWLIALPASSLVEIVIPLGLTVGVWGLIFVRRRRAGPAVPLGAAKWIMVPCLIGLVFWFALMPGPRYGYGITWAMAATSTGLACRVLGGRGSRRAATMLFALVALLLVPTIAYRLGEVYLMRGKSPFSQIPFRGPGPDHGFHPYPTVEVVTVTTRFGVKVLVPITGDKCWGCPLPCLGHNPDFHLRLRREGDLSSGFISDRWGVYGE